MAEPSMEQYERQLAAAAERLRLPRPALPWEQGFAALVLGRRPELMPVFGEPAREAEAAVIRELQRDERAVADTPADKAADAGPASASSMFARRADVNWGEKLSADRRVALEEIRRLVMVNPAGSQLGRHLMRAHGRLATDSELQSIVADTFGLKATSTLKDRSRGLKGFLDWCAASGVANPVPLSEDSVYDYLKHLELGGAAPTRGLALAKSLTFFGHVAGLGGALEAVQSRRVQGVIANMHSNKRATQRKPPLSVRQVSLLEDAVFDLEEMQDRLAAGAFMFCLLSRCRFGDAQKLQELSTDFAVDERGLPCGFIEGRSTVHKTSNSIEKRTHQLPFVAPERALSSRSWAVEWHRLRGDQGLSLEGGAPLLPTPKVGGGWLSRPVSTSEAAAWLRRLLVLQGELPEDVSGLACHSLKCTTLSWCAKAGVEESTRLLLGHHLAPGQKMAVTYARDAMAAPLRKLIAVIGQVRRAELLPDSTRSGYLVAEDGKADDGPVPSGAPQEAESSAEEPGKSCSSDSSSDASSSGPPADSASDASDEPLDERGVVVNTATWVAHLRTPNNALRLACGRRVALSMDDYDASFHSGTRMCRVCFPAAGAVCRATKKAKTEPAVLPEPVATETDQQGEATLPENRADTVPNEGCPAPRLPEARCVGDSEPGSEHGSKLPQKCMARFRISAAGRAGPRCVASRPCLSWPRGPANVLLTNLARHPAPS